MRVLSFPNNHKDLDPSYKMDLDVLGFPNNPKDLDPSYKTDLDFWGLFWKEKNSVL